MKTALIIDSTAGLSEDLRNHPDIYEVYLSTIFPDGSEYIDSSDEDIMNEFYTRMDSEAELPTTSQPQPNQFYNLFDRLIDSGYDTVFGLFISSKISGTYQTAYTVAQEYTERLDVRMLDTQLTSFAIEGLVLNWLKLVEQEKTAQEIEEQMKALITQSHLYFTISTMKNLVKGGRVSAVTGVLGNLLNIKPIIALSATTDGEAKIAEKVRTKKKAFNRMRELTLEHVRETNQDMYISIGHTNAYDDAMLLHDALINDFPNKQIRVGFVTPVLGTHAGSGALAINIVPLLD